MRRALGIVAVIVLLAAATAQAAAPRASMTDIEDEVMCPVCGTLLELADSPQALREKAFVRRLIARGDTKAQVESALVAQYGRDVLANPPNSGFDITNWLVPALGVIAAAVALLVGVRRWRRDGGPADEAEAEAPGDEDAKRLDADLARYDL